MGWFLSRRPHPQVRELKGLRCCIVAWRRAVIEAWYRERAASQEELARKLSQLNWYNHGAGGADPFTDHVLHVPVGDLEPQLYLEAEWRIDTAASIAWALGLVDEIPPMAQRSDSAMLETFFPLQGSLPAAVKDARLRDRAAIIGKVTEWRQNLKAASANRDGSVGSPTEEAAAFEFSRAYERTRGLVWVLTAAPSIDDTDVDV